MIIARYLAKEVMQMTLSVTTALMLIFSAHQLIRFFGSAAEGQFPLLVALKLVLLQWPILLGYFLPFFLFLSIIATYARLNQNQEMIVLKSSGIGQKKLLQYTMRFVFVVVLFEAFFVFGAKPWLGAAFQSLKADALSAAPLQWVTPGKFQSLNHGNVVYYAESANASHDEIHHVFAAFKAAKGEGWNVLFADSGHHQSDKNGHEHYVVLSHGNQYSGEPGSASYQSASFDALSKHIVIENKPQSSNAKFVSTQQLWDKRHIPFFAAELHWRAAGVISMILLVFLAIPMSQSLPRRSGYGRISSGVLIYVIYINCLLVTRSWIKQGEVDLLWGMWPVHLVMGAFVLGMYLWHDKDRYREMIKHRMQ